MKQIYQILKEKNLLMEESKYVKKLFDFETNEIFIKNEFLNAGKELVGEKFTVLKEQSFVISELLKYFTGNQSVYDLKRGIYLFGVYGIGKSMFFEIIRKTLSNISKLDEFGKNVNPNGFMVTSLEKIIETYKADGNMDYYGYRRESTPIHLLINEFGKKLNEKIYGTEANELIYSLMMIRYELFQKGILTHVTSNTYPADLKLEPILMDRAIEMFNFVEIKGESFRK